MGNKILLVEDQKSILAALSKTLQKKGFTVFSASDGEEGFVVAQKELPDLILLDIIMPKMNGIHTLEALKKSKKTQDIPVVILTNQYDREFIQQTSDLGATEYLVKIDWKLNDLVEKIESSYFAK